MARPEALSKQPLSGRQGRSRHDRQLGPGGWSSMGVGRLPPLWLASKSPVGHTLSIHLPLAAFFLRPFPRCAAAGESSGRLPSSRQFERRGKSTLCAFHAEERTLRHRQAPAKLRSAPTRLWRGFASQPRWLPCPGARSLTQLEARRTARRSARRARLEGRRAGGSGGRGGQAQDRHHGNRQPL